MKAKIRRRMTSAALTAALGLLAACAGMKDQGVGWDDAFTYTPPTHETAMRSAERDMIRTTASQRTAAIDTGAPVKLADANKDGKVTKDEAQVDPALAAAFDQYDKNKDGTLDSKEFETLVASNRERHPRNGNEAEFSRMELAMSATDDDELGFDAWREDRDRLYSRNPNLSPWY